jgi:hypothetical protein
MRQDTMHYQKACALVRRLREIPMSDHERQTALEELRRGERFAEFLMGLARAPRRLALILRRLARSSWRSRKGTSYVQR